MKKRLIMLAVVGILGTSSAIFASTIKGTTNVLPGRVEEFHTQMLEQKKAILDQRVKDGVITQEEADSMYNTMKNYQSACVGAGTGNAGLGRGRGMGMRRGAGFGYGMGMGHGMGIR